MWKYWKEVNEKIFWKRPELQDSNFLRAKEEANRCLNTAYYDDPYEALQEIKEFQRSLHGVYMNKDQRHEINDILSNAWDKVTSRIAEIKEEKRRKHEEWLQRQEERKHEEWRERMESNIERWERSIQNAENYISRLEEQIDRLVEEKPMRERMNMLKELEAGLKRSKKKLKRLENR